VYVLFPSKQIDGSRLINRNQHGATMLANGIKTRYVEENERTAKTRANPTIRDLLLELSQIVVGGQ
jgi:hypothetical protein